MEVNWVAVVVGVIAAFALGFLVYGPLGFQKRWAEGTRISPAPPARFPVAAMGAQIAALALLSVVVGITATTDSLGLAVLAILAFAAQAGSVGAWAQKSGFAIAVDTGYAMGCGALMIAAQGIF